MNSTTRSSSISNDVLAYAQEYVAAGISVIPLLLDGTKAPALRPGEPQVYSKRLPTSAELAEWFGRPDRGIGMKCGAVSGGLEVIDFDMAELFEPALSMLPKDLYRKLTGVETPGGWHLIYRCREICGNRKIAQWEPAKGLSQIQNGHREATGLKAIGKGVRIESRGEGGYVVAVGSPARTHATGLPYVQVLGPKLPDVQEITPDERRQLWQAAATFDCPIGAVESKRVKQAKWSLKRELYPERYQATGDEPWAWFDHNGRPDEILRKHGWHSDNDERWTRPGKSVGISAVLGENSEHIPVLTVFSTSAGPLSPQSGEAYRSFGPFALLAALEYGGDRMRAASFVRKELMRL